MAHASDVGKEKNETNSAFYDVELGLYTAPSGLGAVAGQGLFTDHDIAKRSTIGAYTGKLLTAAEKEARYPKNDARYVFQLSANRFIDASDANLSSIARFANHKPRKSANAEINQRGNVRATKRIPEGNEIFVTYGPRYRIPTKTIS